MVRIHDVGEASSITRVFVPGIEEWCVPIRMVTFGEEECPGVKWDKVSELKFSKRQSGELVATITIHSRNTFELWKYEASHTNLFPSFFDVDITDIGSDSKLEKVSSELGLTMSELHSLVREHIPV